MSIILIKNRLETLETIVASVLKCCNCLDERTTRGLYEKCMAVSSEIKVCMAQYELRRAHKEYLNWQNVVRDEILKRSEKNHPVIRLDDQDVTPMPDQPASQCDMSLPTPSSNGHRPAAGTSSDSTQAYVEPSLLTRALSRTSFMPHSANVKSCSLLGHTNSNMMRAQCHSPLLNTELNITSSAHDRLNVSSDVPQPINLTVRKQSSIKTKLAKAQAGHIIKHAPETCTVSANLPYAIAVLKQSAGKRKLINTEEAHIKEHAPKRFKVPAGISQAIDLTVKRHPFVKSIVRVNDQAGSFKEGQTQITEKTSVDATIMSAQRDIVKGYQELQSNQTQMDCVISAKCDEGLVAPQEENQLTAQITEYEEMQSNLAKQLHSHQTPMDCRMSTESGNEIVAAQEENQLTAQRTEYEQIQSNQAEEMYSNQIQMNCEAESDNKLTAAHEKQLINQRTKCKELRSNQIEELQSNQIEELQRNQTQVDCEVSGKSNLVEVQKEKQSSQEIGCKESQTNQTQCNYDSPESPVSQREHLNDVRCQDKQWQKKWRKMKKLQAIFVSTEYPVRARPYEQTKSSRPAATDPSLRSLKDPRLAGPATPIRSRDHVHTVPSTMLQTTKQVENSLQENNVSADPRKYTKKLYLPAEYKNPTPAGLTTTIGSGDYYSTKSFIQQKATTLRASKQAAKKPVLVKTTSAVSKKYTEQTYLSTECKTPSVSRRATATYSREYVRSYSGAATKHSSSEASEQARGHSRDETPPAASHTRTARNHTTPEYNNPRISSEASLAGATNSPCRQVARCSRLAALTQEYTK